ncbi:hypothetical protein K438DRAFT_1774195 [Mycena galopus ATCC 62051]|nr:hypothetical protein K438DRAFT_1774195 [Mycena galopus ATCC 62051]
MHLAPDVLLLLPLLFSAASASPLRCHLYFTQGGVPGRSGQIWFGRRGRGGKEETETKSRGTQARGYTRGRSGVWRYPQERRRVNVARNASAAVMKARRNPVRVRGDRSSRATRRRRTGALVHGTQDRDLKRCQAGKSQRRRGQDDAEHSEELGEQSSNLGGGSSLRQVAYYGPNWTVGHSFSKHGAHEDSGNRARGGTDAFRRRDTKILEGDEDGVTQEQRGIGAGKKLWRRTGG